MYANKKCSLVKKPHFLLFNCAWRVYVLRTFNVAVQRLSHSRTLGIVERVAKTDEELARFDVFDIGHLRLDI